ncbi:hypothetical protein ACTXMH_12255 [Psychrobacter celer]|uniref:hypothetical protein n=1 Tax=Psychrobacter TaxID=497 RepID=UPI003FD5B85D
MPIWLVVGIIIFFIIIYNYRKNSRYSDSNEAYEKTLLPMAEWWIIAGDSTIRQKEHMSYSLILQAATIIESKGLAAPGSLKKIMNSNSKISRSNFVLFIMETVSDNNPDKFEFLKKSFNTDQARVHFAKNIEILLKSQGGLDTFSLIALKACYEPVH